MAKCARNRVKANIVLPMAAKVQNMQVQTFTKTQLIKGMNRTMEVPAGSKKDSLKTTQATICQTRILE